MAAVAGRIADSGANIDRIERMARYPVTAIDLHVSGTAPDRLRKLLSAEAAAQGVDIAVQPASLLRRAMRLIVMDVDSTLIQGEVIEMIAAHSGHEERVAAVTERAMRGALACFLVGLGVYVTRSGNTRGVVPAGEATVQSGPP